jgi:hypothetical protein
MEFFHYLVVSNKFSFGRTVILNYLEIKEKDNNSIKLTARTVCGLSGKVLGAAAYLCR